MHELAGLCGVDPAPLTLRELCWMAEAKRRHDWGLASSLMAFRAEISRDAKKRSAPYRARDFDPFEQMRLKKLPRMMVDITALRDVFVK